MISIRHLLATVLAAFALNAYAAVEANQATQAELETVKGIGPALSTKILNARKGTAFRNWTDLVERVPGVGPGNAARFSQAGLTVAGSGYVAAPVLAKAARATKAATAASDKPAKAAKPAAL